MMAPFPIYNFQINHESASIKLTSHTCVGLVCALCVYICVSYIQGAEMCMPTRAPTDPIVLID